MYNTCVSPFDLSIFNPFGCQVILTIYNIYLIFDSNPFRCQVILQKLTIFVDSYNIYSIFDPNPFTIINNY